ALARHDAILKEAIGSHNGLIVKSTGDGVHAAFGTALQAVSATLAAQQALSAGPWDEIEPQVIRVRMGLHTGEAELRDGDYFGATLNRAARIMSAGHGGQVLLSAVSAELVRRELPAGITLLDLGEHHLKGLLHAEHIFQVCSPELIQDFPRLNSLLSATNNLPTQLTTFIGRERELMETQEKLAVSRLLTLVGPGGTGKTRLAIQIGSDQLDRFKDGVWLVELAPIADPAFIESTIADVFGIREAQGVPLITLVGDYLRAREALLLLDNCEHLVEPVALVAAQLMRLCPKLKIIASTREALTVEGETVYRVPSLSLPARASQDLLQYEATRLFIERATRAEPRFRATADNAAAILQICRRLDGIPLAIELAAARVKLLAPEQIAKRLDDRFKLLSGGSRTALPRQQTLRALIDWSYHSLNELEQRVLRRLAVFAGGWTIEGAEAVVGEAEALDGLQGLVNKSLVNVMERSGAARYTFLETIRQYAMEKLLETDEAIETRDRHLDYILNLPGPAEPGLFGPQSIPYLDQMEEEHDNLRAALEWASTRDPGKAVSLALAAGDFWLSRDYNTEAEAWCQTILTRSEGAAKLAASRARLYAVLCQAAIFMGEHDIARPAAEAGLALAQQANDRSAVVRLYALLGLACMYLGDAAASRDALQSGQNLAREMDLPGELAMILVLSTQANYFSGGDMDQTRAYAAEAESLAGQLETQWSNIMLGFAFARLTGLLGNIPRARVLFQQSIEIAEKAGNLRVVYSCRSELAHMLRRNGELEEALELYVEVLPKWRDLGHRSAAAHELECMAFILNQKAQPEAAITLLGSADSLRAAANSAMTKPERLEYDSVISELHSRVEEDRFRRCWETGRSMDMEHAVDYALRAAAALR
ncbi:MAG TPA: tetratricopeptide repeat protein, partial [Anaerolineales bacterium]|nr:tetratricopeptide repeat protein [Anaerolineales bacterium]